MNMVKSNCYKCHKEITISADEKMIFEYGYCDLCITAETRMIRNKVVMGFYKLPEIKEQLATKLVVTVFENTVEHLKSLDFYRWKKKQCKK